MYIVKNHRHAVPIDILPDNVFLEIFSFSIEDPFEYASSHWHPREWKTLVHVCQRWRGIIFASPRRLDLHLRCSHGTPVRKNLVFWPATLPLIVDYDNFGGPISPEDEDNIDAALEHPSRVRRVNIHAKSPLMKKVITALWKSFPVLTHLDLTCHDSVHPVISRRILRGSNIPHLQHLYLRGISFPQLPSPFSSARNLVSLQLKVMPVNGYVSPDAMARSLAVLTRLKHLSIAFYEDLSPSEQSRGHPYPQIRAVLPPLTSIYYEGESEYLEDFLAQIDTPRVDSLTIEYTLHRIQASQLSWYIERTENLKIDQFMRAQLYFYTDNSLFGLNRSQGEWIESRFLMKIIDEAYLEEHVWEMVHLIGQISAKFSKVNDLFTHGDNIVQWDGMGLAEWLPLFRLFPAVETLRLSGRLAVYVASAFEDSTEEMVTDVFPALNLIRIAECEDGSPEDKDKHQENLIFTFWCLYCFFYLPQVKKVRSKKSTEYFSQDIPFTLFNTFLYF